MKTIGLSFASLIVLGLTLPGIEAGAATTTDQLSSAAMPRNVSQWVGASQKVGSAEESKQVSITVFLSFKNLDKLQKLVTAQSTPGNPQYGKFLTPDAFRQQFSPDASKVALVQDTLKGLGFVIEDTPKSGLFVEARGTVAQVKAAFGVSQELYSYKGKVLRANAETPKLPAKIAGIVTYVAGLDDTAALRVNNHIGLREEAAATTSKRSAASIVSAAPPPVQAGNISGVCSSYWGDHQATLSTAPDLYPATLPWLMCGYTPQQMREAYGSNKVPEKGDGVRVAIVDVYASPTIKADVNHYAKNHDLPPLNYLNFQQIVPPGIYNVPADDPCGPQGWYEEETLDVEAVHSMAPKAFIVYGGIACTDPGNAPLYHIIDNHLADIITNSYSFNGEALPADFIAAENQFFMQAAAEGISVLFSSADDGDLAAINGIASGSWEATSPWVTAVGGTSLALLDAAGKKTEWGWGDYRAFLNAATVSTDGTTITTSGAATPFTFYSGAGGGPSLVMLAPDYQAAVSYSLSAYTHLESGATVWLQSPHRVTPDISMVGDPYTGFLYGETYTPAGDPILDAPCTPLTATTEYCEQSIGGTSLSSPLFAGVLALVDQARFENGKSAVGFVNPALYQLRVGNAGTKSAAIIDVKAPKSPTAVLRGYLGDPTKVRVVTMNSVPNKTDTSVKEGANTSLRTTQGYDNVTGVGTPYVPDLIQVLLSN